MLAEALLPDRLGALDVPKALRLGVLIFRLAELLLEPAPPVGASDRSELCFHFPVIAWPEGANAFLALDQDGQCRRLHAADRCLVEAALPRIEGRHGARAVDSDQPVGL